MRSPLMRTRAWCIRGAALLPTLLVAVPLAAQAPAIAAPYSMEEVLFLVQSPMAEARVGTLVVEGCLAFEMDAFTISELREAGASLALIRTFNEACVIEEESPAQTPTPAPTKPTPTPTTTGGATTGAAPSREATPTRRAPGPGFYGSGSWLRMQYGSIEDTQSGGLTLAKMTGDMAEFGFWGTAAKTPTAVAGGMGIGEIALWDADTGMSLNLFFVTPSPTQPLGIYAGGLASFSRAWLSGGFGDGINRYRYGWEAGVFGRVGTDRFSFIPRAVIQKTKNNLASGVDTEPWSVRTIIMGAEAKLGGVVPGIFVHLADGTTLTVIGLTFAF